MNKWPAQKDVELFYGDPDLDNNGQPDAKWESLNLTYFIPPYPMFWSWNLRPVKQLRVHKKCAHEMYLALLDISKTFSEAELDFYQLNRCGGAYNFRLMRGGNRLSMHSYGCAIDLSPEMNGLGVKWVDDTRMMPKEAVTCFKKQGATWGGLWHNADAMHFQFANV